MSTQIINDQAFMALMGREIKAEMLRAAEPIVQKALAEVEAEMRRRLAEMVMGKLVHDYDVMRNGERLMISVRFGGGK